MIYHTRTAFHSWVVHCSHFSVSCVHIWLRIYHGVYGSCIWRYGKVLEGIMKDSVDANHAGKHDRPGEPHR
jgi:hypothetical protein